MHCTVQCIANCTLRIAIFCTVLHCTVLYCALCSVHFTLRTTPVFIAQCVHFTALCTAQYIAQCTVMYITQCTVMYITYCNRMYIAQCTVMYISELTHMLRFSRCSECSPTKHLNAESLYNGLYCSLVGIFRVFTALHLSKNNSSWNFFSFFFISVLLLGNPK